MSILLLLKCTAFLNEYGLYVIDLADQDFDPQVICKKLKAC
jgi:hypothetical protein